MKDIKVKKRGWVKNVAIIFLAVMLILTFFSNTIMNRRLPEVAAQYTTSGTITARIRGSGTVTANENFEVKVEQTRMVSEVRVRKDEEVLVGDVLIVFEDDISKELAEAEEALHKVELELEKKLLEMSRPDGDLVSANHNIQRKRSELNEAQQAQARIPYSEEALNQAQDALDQARALSRQAEVALREAQAARVQSQRALTAAQETLSLRETDVAEAQRELDFLLGPLAPPDTTDEDIEQARDARRDARAARDRAQRAFDDAEAVHIKAEETVATAGYAVDDAPAYIAERQQELKVQQDYRDDWAEAGDGIRKLQQELEKMIQDLSDAQAGANIDASLEEIKLRELRRDVDIAREALEKLQRDGGSSEITALVAGKVTAVNITPGNRAEVDTVLMVIEVADRGYTLNLSVTAAQAARVNIGDRAEVETFWWNSGGETSAILTGIRNDPQPPGTNRILTFAVSGDVNGGDELTLTMSQRSENYNIIVPNAALRSDTNGDFVLVVMSRPSPLGNRFIATRADVTILASDDTNTAVTGDLTGWDFVITASNRPIEPGMQVRLVDNP